MKTIGINSKADTISQAH